VNSELIDEVIFRTDIVRVGRFRCPIGYRNFAHAGRPLSHLVAFPRSSVWIRPSRARAFIADTSVATIYNPGEEYSRAPVSPEGDRSDYFGVSADIAAAIVAESFASSLSSPEPIFRAAYTRTSMRLYAHQRVVYTRLRLGLCSSLEAEEQVIGIVAEAVTGSPSPEPSRRACRDTRDAHEALAFGAKSILTRDIAAAVSVASLAGELGTSPYHLCRVFRVQTGMSLHHYQLDLRLRAALERLAHSRADLSEIAFELGFSSHSHFSAALRHRLGMTPSQARRLLRRC
jgi:AraC-like DNA-binding protein